MATYQTSITAPLDREEAFATLSRFDRAAKWDPGVAEGTMLTPGPVGLGSRFALQCRFGGRTLRLDYAIVDFEPGSRVVLRAENAFIRSIDTITFESVTVAAQPVATVVTYAARLEPKGVLRLAEPMLGIAFRRIGDRAAVGLERFLRLRQPA